MGITDNIVTADVAMALDNLASTAMSKTDAIDTLAATNKQLAQVLAHVTKENEKFNMDKNQTSKTGHPKQLLLDPWFCHGN